jgi:hypothetical protein
LSQGEAPVVFQAEYHAGLLCFRYALFDAVDDPLETIVILVAGQRLLDSAIFHQIVEAFACAPCAGIETYERDAKLVSKLDTFDSVVDVLLPVLVIR